MKILIADDHKVFREGLHLLLKQAAPHCSVLEASNGKEVLDLLNLNSVDVILMDVEMPVMNGIETTKALKKGTHAAVPVIALTMYNQLPNVLQVYDAGASGYLTKDSTVKEILQAIERVTNGDEYFAAAIKTPFMKELLKRERSSSRSSQDQLTPREKEVLIMICEQHSTEDIARVLFVSPLTVNNHRRSILAKTGAKNVAGLVVYAVKNGLFRIE